MTQPSPGEIPLSLGGTSLFGVVSVVLVFTAAVVFFAMSLTHRHGRSRWPLHALMATGIIGIGSGVIAICIAVAAGQLEAVETDSTPFFGQMVSGPLWLVMGGTFSGALAGIRAIIGMIREPGPRF